MAAIVPFLYLSSAIFGFSATYGMFGFNYHGSALAIMPLFISTLIFINGLCAFGLLFGKAWGLNACLIYGYIGASLTIISMFSATGILIRLELLIFIPYLIKLHKIKGKW